MPGRVLPVLVLILAASVGAYGCDSERAAPMPTSPPALPITQPRIFLTQAPNGVTEPRGWEIVGISVQGRPIRIRTVGHGPRKVLFIGGIHGDEPEGAYSAAELPPAFATTGRGDAVTLTILEDANPDGRAAGTRDNGTALTLIGIFRRRTSTRLTRRTVGNLWISLSRVLLSRRSIAFNQTWCLSPTLGPAVSS